MTLKLALLGRPQVVINGQDCTAHIGDKPLAVLAYLALETPPPLAREKLAGIFWPDKTDEAARYRLRNTLWNLRRDLGPTHILADDDHCWLDPVTVQIDVGAFQTDVKALRDPQDLLALAALYRGDFLENILVRDAPAFEEWLLVERERLQLLYQDVLWRAAQAQQATGNSGDAVPTLTRLIQVDPLRERNYRALMKAHAGAGDRATALRIFDQCTRTLAAELAVAPAVETQRLRDQIAQNTTESWSAELDHRLVQAELALAAGRSDQARTLIQSARQAIQNLFN